ncbi:glycosyltransferase [Lacinutrix chionoecetis]
MRVLQLIDSLQTGGAERMAVNIANVLSSKIEGSFLCATREEGLLKASINAHVEYLFLNKKKTIDYKAIKKLNAFVKQHEIAIIHAHSTSFFLATIIKILNKKIKIVWHDHYGQSEFLEARSFNMIKICSRYFSQIYSVNQGLETWAKQHLHCKQVKYLSNFAVETKVEKNTNLKGTEGKRIIHLANLREQKDHATLFEAFKTVSANYPEWSLHCVGKDFNNSYSEVIHKKIEVLNLKDKIVMYGSKPDVSNILMQSTLAVLPSKSEGLPIALLEYGLAGLPTIATNVGNCNLVIANPSLGELIAPEDASLLSQAIINYISHLEEAKTKGAQLKEHVRDNFSEDAISKTLINDYKSILT